MIKYVWNTTCVQANVQIIFAIAHKYNILNKRKELSSFDIFQIYGKLFSMIFILCM